MFRTRIIFIFKLIAPDPPQTLIRLRQKVNSVSPVAILLVTSYLLLHIHHHVTLFCCTVRYVRTVSEIFHLRKVLL